MEKIFVVVIEGPTASGKTSLGVELSERLNGEIVSADSMQIYEGMDIATAKPTKAELERVRHHLIGFVSPCESYSAYRFKDDAMKAVFDIHSRGKLPLIVGGTGLYIDTLLDNLEFFDTETDEKLRASLYEREKNEGAASLYAMLKRLDPVSAEKIHENNTKKIIRALEVYYQTGRTLSEQTALSKLNESPLDPVIISLTAKNRDFLYDRINKRVDLMASSGLVAEAESFFRLYGVKTAGQAIGYKELLPYFNGEISLDEALESLKKQTRHYAKRQLTWFRRNEKAHCLNIDEYSSRELADEAVKIINERRTNEK